MFEKKKIEKRILEIKHILGDEERRKNMPGETVDCFEKQLIEANRPLIAELEELQIERKFIHDNYNLLVNIITIAVALAIAFGVPFLGKLSQEKTEKIKAISEVRENLLK